AQIPGGGQGLHQADAPPSAVSGGPDVSRTYRRWHLIGIPVRDMPKRAPDDLEVEPQRPLIDVVEIEFEAPLRLLHRVDLAAKPLTCASPVIPGLTRCREKYSLTAS